MHPLWLAGSTLEGFLDPLVAVGLRSVEFELDPHQTHWSGFEPLIAACHSFGLRLCFHAPYRPPFSLEGFSGDRRNGIVGMFSPMLTLAQTWSAIQGGLAPVVVHPARSKRASCPSLVDDTRLFLVWAIERFPGLQLALENTGPAAQGEVKVGDSRQGVYQLVAEIDHPRLGLCWDLGHDALHHRAEPPDLEWVARVAHVHVHDLDENGLDHYPLVYGRVPVCDWLLLLKAAGMRGTITLELKGNQLAAWEPSRINRALSVSLAAIRGCVL